VQRNWKLETSKLKLTSFFFKGQIAFNNFQISSFEFHALYAPAFAAWKACKPGTSGD